MKGIALSGFEDDIKESYQVLPQWVADFIQTRVVKEMHPGQYFTIAFPRIAFDQFKEPVFAQRQTLMPQAGQLKFKSVHGEKPHTIDERSLWVLARAPDYNTKDRDSNYLAQGHIVITPMTVDENDLPRLQELAKSQKGLPRINAGQ